MSEPLTNKDGEVRELTDEDVAAMRPARQFDIARLAPAITNSAEHREALRVLSAYFDDPPEPGTPEGDHFDALIAVVERYESRLAASPQ